MFGAAQQLVLVDCTVIGGDGGLPNIYGLAAIMACDSHIRLAGSCDIQVATSTKVASRTLASTLMVLVGHQGHPAPIVDLDPHGIVSGYWPPPIQITNIGPVPAVRVGSFADAGISRRDPVLRALVPDHPRRQQRGQCSSVDWNRSRVPDPSSLFVVDNIGAASAPASATGASRFRPVSHLELRSRSRLCISTPR